MKNQTLPSDANNRYKKGINALENELRSIWLGIRPALGTPFYLTSSSLQRN
jgi:hypothetical protein